MEIIFTAQWHLVHPKKQALILKTVRKTPCGPRIKRLMSRGVNQLVSLSLHSDCCLVTVPTAPGNFSMTFG